MARAEPFNNKLTSGNMARALAISTLLASLLWARLPRVRIASSFSKSVTCKRRRRIAAAVVVVVVVVIIIVVVRSNNGGSSN